MKPSSLLKPRAYRERIQKLRRFLRSTPRQARNRWWWVLRRSLQPHFHPPMWVDCGADGRYFLGDDPVDDEMLEYLLGSWQPVYFPPGTLLPDDALLLDLGAHHGLFVVAALSRWPGAHMIAVEPDPTALAYVRRNVEGNGFSERVEIVPHAIARQEGRGKLVVFEDDSCAHYLEESTAGEGIEVSTTTIAKMLAGRRPDFVKCNAEGAEYFAIPALLDLHRPRVLVMEVHHRYGDRQALLDDVEKRGYRVEPVEPPIDWWQCFRKD